MAFAESLSFRVQFQSRQGARALVENIRAEEDRARQEAERKEVRAQKRVQREAEKAQKELIERRRRLAIDAIEDEGERRRRIITENYKEERRRIKQLLQARKDAGEITERQFDAQLRNFDRDLRRIRDRGLQQNEARTLSGRIGSRLSTAALLGGGALIGAEFAQRLQQSIRLAADFEAQLKEVQKTTGLAEREIEILGDQLLDLAGRTGAAQDDLAAIAATAGQLGITNTTEILALTETVAKFTEVTELSAEDAARALATISNAFQEPVEEAENLGSSINELSNTTAATAADIVTGLSKVGSAGRSLRLTSDQVGALVATLVDAGIQAETAGTSLRNVFIRLQTEAKTLAQVTDLTAAEFSALVEEDALAALQAYLDGLNGISKAQRAIKIKEVFGDENFLAVSTLAGQVDRLNTNLTTSADAFREGTSLTREYNTQLDSLSAQWNIFTANVTRAATAQASKLIPALKEALRFVNLSVQGISGLADEVGRLDTRIQETGEAGRALEVFERLSTQSARSAEETARLRQAAATLQAAFPGYVARTNDAGEAVAFYTEQLRRAISQQEGLSASTRTSALEDIIAQYTELNTKAREARESQERLIEIQRRNDPRNLPAGTTSLERSLAGTALVDGGEALERYLEKTGAEAARLETELRQATITLVDLFQTADGYETEALVNLFIRQGLSAEDAAIAVDDLVFQYERLTSARDDLAGTEDPESTAPAGPTEVDKEVLAARERLEELLAQARLNAMEDGLEKELALIRARYDAERKEIARTTEAALKGADEATAARIRAQEREARAAIARAEERDSFAAILGQHDDFLEELQTENAAYIEGLVEEEEVAQEEITDAYDRAQRERFERLMDYYNRLYAAVRRYSDVIVEEAFNTIIEPPEITDAEIDLERARFEEEEAALRESLRTREISQREFNARMKELAVSRSQFEKEVERDRAGFLKRSYEGVRDVAIQSVEEEVKEFIAKKTTELLFAKTVESEKTASVVAGVATRVAALGTEVLQSLRSAAASLVDAVAKATEWLASKLGPFAILGIPALAGAAAAGFVATKKAMGFAEGGYTGGGGRYQVAGVVHRGEVVMEAPIVRGQEREWLALRALVQRGLKLEDLLHMLGMPGYAEGGLVDGLASGLDSLTIPAPEVSVQPAGASDMSGVAARLDALNQRVATLDENLGRYAERPTRLIQPQRTARRHADAATAYSRVKDPRTRD